MTAMRAVLLVLLLVLAGCVSRETPPRPTTATTTTSTTTTWTGPTNPAKGVVAIERDLAAVRAWLTTCAPGMPRPPACDWASVHATAASVIGLIEARVASGPRPETQWRLDAATEQAAHAFSDFGEHCVDWLNSGGSADVMVQLNCANRWEWLPFSWTELEAAVAG